MDSPHSGLLTLKTKICNKCGETKDLTTEFWVRDGCKKDGFHGTCKSCKKEYSKKYWQKNRKKLKENHKIYYEENKEKFSESNKQYRMENKEIIASRMREYNIEKRESISVNKKAYHLSNKEKILKDKKRYYRENKEKVKAVKKEYATNNKEKIKARRKEHNRQLAKYSTCGDRLFADTARCADDGFLEVICKTCGTFFKPTNSQVSGRVSGLRTGKGECHFYCSEECKRSCSVFRRKSSVLMRADMVAAGHIAPDLHGGFYNEHELHIWSEKVKEGAGSTCEICGATGVLHAHHINPKTKYPEQALDPANGVCLCPECHHRVGHSSSGCKNSELRKCKVN